MLQCTALGGAQYDNADGGNDAADSTSNVADLANNLEKWAFEHFSSGLSHWLKTLEGVSNPFEAGLLIPRGLSGPPEVRRGAFQTPLKRGC